MTTLFEISERLIAAYEAAESGEYDEEAIQGSIETIEWELDEKADNYAHLIKIINGEIDMLKAEEQRLNARRKQREAFIARLKHNLEESMLSTGRTKFKTVYHTFYIQKNPPALQIVDEDKLPGDYWIQPPPIIDKSTIKDVLNNGGEVDGAVLTQSKSVRIK